MIPALHTTRPNAAAACLLASAALLTACDAGVPVPDAAPADAATADAGPAPRCERAAPRIGGTPEADALASAPARCGQAAHVWLREGVGEVVSTATTMRFSASALAGLVGSQGVTLPEPLAYGAALSRLTYTTQDRGALLEATALVAVPIGRPAGAPAPDVVLFLHGSSGFADGCGPTRDIGGQLLAALLASFGWVVVAPDYLGLRGDGVPSGFPHPYLVGQPTAIASLDAARALLTLPPDSLGGACPSGRVLVLGGSQGGHAALYVDRLAPYYARELELVGTVATVPPADVVAQLTRALTTLTPATANSLLFFGLAPSWYGAGDRLSEVFVPPLDTEVTARIGMGCDPGGPYDPESLESVFAPGLLEAAVNDEVASYGDFGCMAAESSLVATSIPRLGPNDPSYSILFVLAGADPLVHSPIERRAAETLCAAGAPIELLECEGAGHIEGTTWALPEILDFARARFAGEVPSPATRCAFGPAVRCRGTPE